MNAAAIRLMAEKGLTAFDIAEIAEAAEARRDPTAAERKRKQRAKEKNGIHCDMSRVTSRRDGSPNEEDNNLTPPVPPVVSNETTSPADLKPEHVVEAWNATAQRHGLALVRKLTPERRRKLATRIRQNTIDEFTEAIAAIERSPFLRGENDRSWKANFNWMLEPANFTKLTEGTYDR